jgi:hypothetical protein
MGGSFLKRFNRPQNVAGTGRNDRWPQNHATFYQNSCFFYQNHGLESAPNCRHPTARIGRNQSEHFPPNRCFFRQIVANRCVFRQIVAFFAKFRQIVAFFAKTLHFRCVFRQISPNRCVFRQNVALLRFFALFCAFLGNFSCKLF